MSDITVQSASVSSLLSEFQGEMGKLDALLNKIDKETSEAKAIWEGDASDATISAIEKFKDVFESIKEQNEKYVEFLNSVIEKYTDEDTQEKTFVTTNDNVFDTNYNGKKYEQ